MAELHYYVIRQYTENGERKTPANYPYSTRAEAEKQYALLLSGMWNREVTKDDPEMVCDLESIEMGTIEQGKIKRESLEHIKDEPAPTPEPEEEPSEE